MDHIARAIAASGYVRAVAAITTETIDEARRRLDTLPTATAAVGRVMTGAALIANMLKDGQKVTIQVRGNGPLKEVVGDADASGNVRGYTLRPHIHLPSKNGKLDVGKAIGNRGTLSVVKDVGLREPYSGIVELVSGEIGEDLSYYFVISEQQPSAVGLGVLVAPDNSVLAAGGYIIQPLNGADEQVIETLERNIKEAPAVSEMIKNGYNAEMVLAQLLKGLDYEIAEQKEINFHCGCSRERAERTLIALGVKEIKEMISEGKTIEMTCHFCNDMYIFSIADLKELLGKIIEKSGLKKVE